MLEVEGLVKTFAKSVRGKSRSSSSEHETVQAVANVSFAVGDGEFVTLLGPSGCGKTTTLRSIAGLERPDAGAISVDDRVLFSREAGVNLPAHDRGLAMVFQSYAIWPHMNVFENAAFGLRVNMRTNGLRNRDVQERVMTILEVVGLSNFADVPATHLSGGQQQRLALARALVTEPQLMLLDEPLSNLDAKLRESMRLELKRLQQEFNVTSLYVTHDQVEAMALSDRIIVMNGGEVIEMGSPREMYLKPRTRFVADFVGTRNLFEGSVQDRTAECVHIDTPIGRVCGPSEEHAPPLSTGAHVIVGVRPSAVRLEQTSADEPGVNAFHGEVITQVFLGDTAECVVEVGGIPVRCQIPASALLDRGDAVKVSFAIEDVSVVPA